MHPDELAMRRTIAYAGGAARPGLWSVMADWLDEQGRGDEAAKWRTEATWDYCDCCGAPVDADKSYDEGRLLEESWRCKFCDTSYDFAYGSYIRLIGGLEFIYSWEDLEDEAFMAELKLALLGPTVALFEKD